MRALLRYSIAITAVVILGIYLGKHCVDDTSVPDASADIAPSPASKWTLNYLQPAAKWTEALPIGNGRLGAMVFGGTESEHLQLNEDTLWAGGPYDPNNTNALSALPEVRRLIFAGQEDEAEKLIAAKMMAVPVREMPYETVGDLHLEFSTKPGVSDYNRQLDLDSAIARVTFTANGVSYRREVYSTPVDQVIVMNLSASKPGMISFTARMTTPQKVSVSVEDGHDLVMSGTNGAARGIAGALSFQARVRILPKGGRLSATDDTITVAGADSVTLITAVVTSYRNPNDVGGDPGAIVRKQVQEAAIKNPATMKSEHLAAHRKLFRRVDINLGETEAMTLPTDVRITRFADGNDPQLAALYFQFARYLLICSSRPGGQPANLQGLWNESMTPPWDGKYTININTEMNYWPAETCNLGECVEPLTRMVMEMQEPGSRTARIHYGARGWVAHHNTDLWRATAPVDGPNSGIWPMGGAWLCQNLWEHYLFTDDKQYLSKIYPAMKGAAEFFLDTLVEEPTHHWLVTCPSLSPENRHPGANTSVTAGPTMDMEILRDLFSNCIRASEILGTDQEFAKELEATRSRLAPLQIGTAGQLQEWLNDWDLQAKEIHHRHVSHLYAAYPSSQIDVNTTPELATAVKKSLEIRGDKATGWGTAWRINLWARLHDGDHAFEILKYLLSPKCTYPDLFDSCPPFQIDGNLGGASGIAEMLLQSQNDLIQLLPALPKAWPEGSVSGLRARGGFEISLSWKDGRMISTRIHSVSGKHCKVRYWDKTIALDLKPGETRNLDSSLSVISQ